MDRFRAGKRLWSREDDEVLAARYPHERTSALAVALGRSLASTYGRAYKLRLTKSAAYLAGPDACRLRREGNPGAASRFKPGHVPANKGLRRPGYAPGKMATTQFKKGGRTGAAARNWRPIGTIAVDTEGYRRIKVREAKPGEYHGFGNMRVWPFLQRHVWEQAHGPIPAGHVVVFLNGERGDARLENLALVSRRELMARNSVHNLPKPLLKAVQLLGALNRQIRRRAHAHEEPYRRPA